MAKFTIHKTKDYTVLSNYHFRDKGLSLKAKGLLSLMLSLPEDWDYSIEGLVRLSSDAKSSVGSGLKELEENKYLVRKPIRDKSKIIDWEYNIYEQGIENALLTDFQEVDNQEVENLEVENLEVENQPQYNTNIYNTKELNIKEEIYKEERFNFKKPSIDEIGIYCNERKNSIDATKFYNYYESVGWLIGKQRMKDWKACVRTWEQRNTKQSTQQYNKPTNSYLDTQLVKTEEGTFKLR